MTTLMLHCRLKTVPLSRSVWDLTIKQTFFDENVPDIVYVHLQEDILYPVHL